jgi:exopolysaccharide biosynthesis polyprenyl glycosylphosphotransferase
VEAIGLFEYFKLGIVAIICICFLYFNNLYTPAFAGSSPKTDFLYMRALGFACLIVALLYLLIPPLELYRGFAAFGITAIVIVLLAHRAIFSAFTSNAGRPEVVVILGEGHFAVSLAKAIMNRPDLGFRLGGYLGNEWSLSDASRSVQRLGGIEDLLKVTNQLRVGRVLVAMGEQRSKLPVDELLALKMSGVVIQDGIDFYEAALGKLPVENVRMSWLIFSQGFKVPRATLLYKRVFSIVVVTVTLLLLFPLILFIAVLIKLDSKGPVIFRQKRIGINGKLFVLYKFRTMKSNADEGRYARPATYNDDRVTRVGVFLRRWRLDEIPQFLNILLGDMYLIGPRPFVPEQEQDCARQIPFYRQRWTVRPGATGWAQVQRGYCATLQDNIDKFSYDLFYIKNMSVGFDLLIIAKTIKIILSAQGGR